MCNPVRLKIACSHLYFLCGESELSSVSREVKNLGQEPRQRLSLSCVICFLLQRSLTFLCLWLLCQIKVRVIMIEELNDFVD